MEEESNYSLKKKSFNLCSVWHVMLLCPLQLPSCNKTDIYTHLLIKLFDGQMSL